MVTLKDIAAKCGLSVATVSKAMNNMPDINPATAQRIHEVAREMGYLPNAAARSMKTGRSMTVGMLMYLGENESLWTHPYSALVADGIHRVLEDNGYDLTPVSFKGAGSMGGYLNYCRHRSYDGLIVMSGGSGDPALKELAESDFPVVSIDCPLGSKGSVFSDNTAGMHILVRYAYNKGHRKIALIHGNASTVTHDRITGFFSGCQELGVEVPDSYIRESRYLSMEDSARATQELLDLPEPPTCIFYPDDVASIGGIRVIRARGLSIPGDVSVIGYDGTQLADSIEPKLTTYRQDCRSVGASAAQMLLHAIARPRAFVPRHIIVPGVIVEGGSVADLNGR